MISTLLIVALAAPPDPGFEAYSALVHGLKPGDRFEVYVGQDFPRYVRSVHAIRWDGYPGVRGPAILPHIVGRDGKPYREVAQRSLGGACRT